MGGSLSSEGKNSYQYDITRFKYNALFLTNSNKMEILIKHYGNSGTAPSRIIELTCKYYDTQFTVDVTSVKGLVDVNLIENLRQVADELEEQNRLVNELSGGVVS